MTKKTLYLLGILATIVVSTLLYSKYCCNCCVEMSSKDAKDPPSVVTETKTHNLFSINGPGFNFQTNRNFSFLKNDHNQLLPIHDSLDLGIEKLKSFLISNPTQKITITGFASPDENNLSKFENLGFARADNIKKYFVSKGLLASQFEINGIIDDEWKTASDTVFGPLEFNFEPIETKIAVDDKWVALKQKINDTPLILYFQTNKSSLNLSPSDKQKIADIKSYLSKVKDAQILIVGHSDNVGNRESNVVLAKKRADFSKNYLIKNGIDSTAIKTESKGPDEPLGDNSTTEGKAKNRRTVITIK